MPAHPIAMNRSRTMKRWLCLFRQVIGPLVGPALLLLAAMSNRAEDWPAWRGPRGDGTSLETNVTIHWTSTNNVLWKTALPGEGHASPIVFGDRVFTVSALAEME